MLRSQPKLHEAMQRILRDRGRPMSTEEVAAENERRDLYRQKKGGFPRPMQIAMRAQTKSEKFEVIIRLRE